MASTILSSRSPRPSLTDCSTCISGATLPHAGALAAHGRLRPHPQHVERHKSDGDGWCAPYATFKGGLEVLTRYMAKELVSGAFVPIPSRPAPSVPNWAGGLTTNSRPCWRPDGLGSRRRASGGGWGRGNPAFGGQPVDQCSRHRSRRRLRHLVGPELGK